MLIGLLHIALQPDTVEELNRGWRQILIPYMEDQFVLIIEDADGLFRKTHGAVALDLPEQRLAHLVHLYEQLRGARATVAHAPLELLRSISRGQHVDDHEGRAQHQGTQQHELQGQPGANGHG